MIHKLVNEIEPSGRVYENENLFRRVEETMDEKMLQTAALMLLKISVAAENFMDTEQAG